MAGSLVRTRSSFAAAISVPSATLTWPAWMDRPIPTPPPWWIDTQVAPLAVLTSALSSGQSAMASEPADAGRQPLVGDPVLRGADPSVQVVVVREQVEHRPVGDRDVGRVARQR